MQISKKLALNLLTEGKATIKDMFNHPRHEDYRPEIDTYIIINRTDIERVDHACINTESM